MSRMSSLLPQGAFSTSARRDSLATSREALSDNIVGPHLSNRNTPDSTTTRARCPQLVPVGVQVMQRRTRTRGRRTARSVRPDRPRRSAGPLSCRRCRRRWPRGEAWHGLGQEDAYRPGLVCATLMPGRLRVLSWWRLDRSWVMHPSVSPPPPLHAHHQRARGEQREAEDQARWGVRAGEREGP